MRLLLLFLTLFALLLPARDLSDQQVKVVYTYNFLKNIDWGENTPEEAWEVAVYTNDPKLRDLFTVLAARKRLHGLPIRLRFLTGGAPDVPPQVLYLDQDYNPMVPSLFSRYEERPVLVITDGHRDQRQVMINLLAEKGKVGFEINRANILAQGLAISPEMVLLGGAEIDVARLYKSSQKAVEAQKKEIGDLTGKIADSQEEAARLAKEIAQNRRSIAAMAREIGEQTRELEERKETLAEQTRLLKIRQEQIHRQNQTLETVRKEMDRQREAVKEEQAKLVRLANAQEEKNRAIREQEALLKRLKEETLLQEEELALKEEKIDTQRSALAVLTLLILVLAALVIRSYEKIKAAKARTEEAKRQVEEAKASLEELHKQMTDSIEYAALIQHALLPDSRKLRTIFDDYFAVWHPRDVVGGDIYLFDRLDEHRFLLLVIDCTGHGVPGAFVTILVKAVERQIVASLAEGEAVSPAAMLGEFNRTIKTLLKQENADALSNAGFDGGILYVDKKENILRFAGAETPLFYVQEGKVKTIKGDRHSIGYRKSDADYRFTDHELSLETETRVYLTTDGYLDQNGGPKGFPFGKKRFQKLIELHYSESFADQQELLLYEMQKYQGDNERNDDVTVIGLKL